MESKEHRTKTVFGEQFKKSLQNNPNIDAIEKEGFDGDNNFIDYFMIIGVKPEIYKNSYLYNSNSISEINNNLIPQIITKFPKMDKKHIVVENSLPQQLFPHGFNAIESETKPENQFYSVILDNQLYSATYTHKFIACLLIYENVKDYEMLNEKYKSTDILFKMMRSNSIKVNNATKPNENYKNFYIPKCLCLVSVYPAFNRFHEILNSLYNLVMSNQFNNLYIDRIIEKLIFEIPKLPRGLKKIYLSLPPNTLINLTENKMNDFPIININLSKFFNTLDISNILDIFRYLLFETKLIFFSSNLYDLTNSIMSMLSLIFPFKYQFQIVSVLPKDLYNFIETISPYIFGINETYDENFFKNNKVNLEDATICIIDIDRNKYLIRIKNEKMLNKDYPPFPKSLKEKIEKDYAKYKKEKETNNKSKEIKNPNVKLDEENSAYQKIFFNFMIALLKDYPKFLSKDYGVTKDISMSIKDMIDLTSYANSYGTNEKEFYNRIFSTQMFIEFIYKRMMPKNYNEKVEILFFEEKINEAKLKKSFFKSKEVNPNLLLTSKEYDYDNITVCIDCSTEISITKEVYDYVIENKDEAEKIFINNGYDIEIDAENESINFKYHIFPCLLSEKFFVYNYQYYKKPELYYMAIDEINLKIVNKSNLQFKSKTKELLTEEGNDIYLCYLIMWSLTLWYTDEFERESRFLQMIEVIEKVQVHDIQIFELLFKALVDIKWSDKDIILLYKKFIHLNLNPTWKIFTLVSKIIKKKANAKNKKELLSQETKFQQLKTMKKRSLQIAKTFEDIVNFRSRTLKTKIVDDKILSEDVIFYAYSKCQICDKNINLINLCSNLYQLKTMTVPVGDTKGSFSSAGSRTTYYSFGLEDEEKKKNETEDHFKCPNKHSKEGALEYSRFKLKLNHGIELFNLKIKSNEDYTSKSFVTLLMSPSTMKSELLRLSKKLEEDNEKFDVENFKYSNRRLFWNLVWFLELNDMDISFMLPYSSELPNEKELNLEHLKDFIDNRYKPDQEINIEKIVKNKDSNLDFLICSNRDSLQGQNIKEEEIKNDLFNKNKIRYEKYDLNIQKIFRFHISDISGLVSYLSFNNYMENIGYNEYPTQFKEAPEISLSNLNEQEIPKKNITYRDSNDIRLSKGKHSMLILDDKNSEPPPIKGSSFFIKNLTKLNTVNFQTQKDKKSLLMRPKLARARKRDFQAENPNSEDIKKINKEIEENNEIKENEDEEEDVDVLSKFKQSQKKEENEDIGKLSLEQNKKNKLPIKFKGLRRSTLRDGILGEDNNENIIDSIN